MSEPTAEDFLKVAHHFKLGELDTESSNPKTERLSQLCQDPATLPDGLNALQSVDVAALETILAKVPEMEELARAIHKTLVSGKKVVAEGCGATGRLSLSLEVFALEGMVIEEEYRDKVRGFMAGGDAALIRSIEQFEDRVAHGQRQLREIGFEDGDLLLAITEGGETPFVIAACEEALLVSPSNNPYFIYCNPDGPLCRIAERSKRVIENERIHKINLSTGPMAITGSTRMQATTVQLACAGLAIRHHAHPEKIGEDLRRLLAATKAVPYGILAPFTAAEAKMYADGEYFLYETDYFSVTVMTDTTERSPTFSLPPFENFNNPNELPSVVYLHLPGVSGAVEGWTRLLRRAPRPLEWEGGIAKQTGIEAIKGYDFSDNVFELRAKKIGADRTKLCAKVHRDLDAKGIRFSLPHVEVDIVFPVADEALLDDKLLLNILGKCLLNAHSTAVMGVYGRFEGNVMTYVRASNNKLIDRATRYVQLLLKRRQADAKVENPIAPAYEDIVRYIYSVVPTLPSNVPVVLQTVKHFMEGGK